jgi:pilus assembly protein Flp/PilA
MSTRTDASPPQFLADRRGAAAIEYALIAAGIGAVLAGTIMTLGANVRALYESIAAIL